MFTLVRRLSNRWPLAASLSLMVLSVNSLVAAPTLAAPALAPTGIRVTPQGTILSTFPDATRARLLVKLRGAVAAEVAPSRSETGGNAAEASRAAAASGSAALQVLARQQAVRRFRPLWPEHARSLRAMKSPSASTSARFPLRERRAPAGAAAPNLAATYLLELNSAAPGDAAAALRALRADPAVLWAEEDRLSHVAYVPDDPSYAAHGSWGQTYDDLYGVKRVGAERAWDFSRGEGVVVAVVDTGIDYRHPDIAANVWTNSGEIPGNGIDDDGNGFVDDVRGWDFVGASVGAPAEDNDPDDGHFHGTHVAGTIAAVGDNALGVIGVAWKAKVMAVKGLDDTGTGQSSDLARAIVYAVDNGADVINASFGGSGYSLVEEEAVNYARAHGVVFVAAAGNSTQEVADFTPASIPAAIAVSALSTSDTLAFFSNYGHKVEVAAPGEDILSLERGTSGYRRASGTSMAAPHVCGVAALILARHPEFSGEQVRQLLRETASDLGPAGRDSSFGYGCVAADAAVQAAAPLVARFDAPADATTIAGPIDLTGTAAGPGFARYAVDVGAGEQPASWTPIRAGTGPVTAGWLGRFDPSALTDGLYTLRLRAFTTEGAVFADEVRIRVRYLAFAWPARPAVPTAAETVKPGAEYALKGRATGPSFQEYRISWAAGWNATSGWSETGISLTGNGATAVADGTLAQWTPPAEASGYYTLKLTVRNEGFVSESFSCIYAEPDLKSARWPQLAIRVAAMQSPTPVRLADGTSRLAVGSSQSLTEPATLSSYTADGAVTQVDFPLGGSFGRIAAANLDGIDGEELVAGDGWNVDIRKPDLTAIRRFDISDQVKNEALLLTYENLTVADLDNDGTPEIIAPGRGSESGALRIFRADGTPFSTPPFPSYPADILSPPCVAVGDLDGDGRKEILLAYPATNEFLAYELHVFDADGSPHPAWTSRTFPSAILGDLVVADLDGDGRSEVIVSEVDRETAKDRIHVLNGDGTPRTGWPAVLDDNYPFGTRAKLAVGDLDGDGRAEVVAATKHGVQVLRADGTVAGPGWTHAGGDDWRFNEPISPLIADLDGDGHPEIVAGVATVIWDDGPLPYHRSTLACYRNDGTVMRRWQLQGTNGNQPCLGSAVVGDFDGDGLTDLMVSVPVVSGGGLNGVFESPALSCLSMGTPFRASASDWTAKFRDSTNASAGDVAPVITAAPRSQVVLEETSVTLEVRAGGSPLPEFRWRKDGAIVPGATGAKLHLARTRLADAGDYVVEIHNARGVTTSQAVTLAVRPLVTAGVPHARDFDGDGRSDLFWRQGAGGPYAAWRMDGTRMAASAVYNPGAEWSVVATEDFDGDGASDLLWRNLASGAVVLWRMNGSNVTSSDWLYTGGPAWVPERCGDFNGDGRSDILWRNAAAGTWAIWRMRGATAIGSTAFDVGGEWSVAAVADFSGDGKTDLLWRRNTDGSLVLWEMNGSAIAASTWIYQGGPAWQPELYADFNGDGRIDILWRNAASGQYAIWLMHGPAIVGTATYDPGAWRLQATADFDGDGCSDLLWRHPDDGSLVLWRMNGTAVAGSNWLYTGGPAWEPVRCDDFNGDNCADLLWYNAAAHQYSIWLMNGADVIGTSAFGVGQDWTAAP